MNSSGSSDTMNLGDVFMEPMEKRLFFRLTALAFLITFLTLACSSTREVHQETPLDTPEHHVFSGLILLDKGYLTDAKREFNLALKLNPRFSRAYLGLGLTYGRERKYQLALDSMCSARDEAKTDEDKASAFVGFMRLYTTMGTKGWLNKVKERFYDALHYKKDLPEAYYYMGVAYRKANRLYMAKKAFEKVIEINKGFVAESREELKSLEKPNG